MKHLVIEYKSRLGNNLFQFAIGKILSTIYEYKLHALPIPNFQQTYGYDYKYKKYLKKAKTHLKFKHKFDFKNILPYTNLSLLGYFQNLKYYETDQLVLKILYGMDLTNKIFHYMISPDDILMYVRLGDLIKTKDHLPPKFYLNALEKVNPNKNKKIYISTDSPNSNFFKHFKDYNIIFPEDVNDPFFCIQFAKRFKTVIMSSGTFSFWATLLSPMTEFIITPVWMRKRKWAFSVWSIPNKDMELRIDEKRFHYTYIRNAKNDKNLIENYIEPFHKYSNYDFLDLGD